jgi:hypothetical protein
MSTDEGGPEFGEGEKFEEAKLGENFAEAVGEPEIVAMGENGDVSSPVPQVGAASSEPRLLWSAYRSFHAVKCEDCCRDCCYSTPFITLGTVCYTTLSLLGFTISSIVGTVQLSSVPHLQNGTALMAPVVAGAVVGTILPILAATILAYCITGYIRDSLFGGTVKKCIGPSCNILIMAFTFFYCVVWMLIIAGFSGVLFYHIQAKLVCEEFEGNSPTGLDNVDNCFHYADKDFKYTAICGGDGLKELCNEGLEVGLSYAVALIFSFLVAIGFVILLVVQTANFVSVKDNLEYRKGANYNRSTSDDGIHLKHR